MKVVRDRKGAIFSSTFDSMWSNEWPLLKLERSHNISGVTSASMCWNAYIEGGQMHRDTGWRSHLKKVLDYLQRIDS